MPIYEFECEKCNHRFEELILCSGNKKPACPDCGNKKVRKLMSAGSIRAHGIPTGSGGFKAPSCAPTGG